MSWPLWLAAIAAAGAGASAVFHLLAVAGAWKLWRRTPEGGEPLPVTVCKPVAAGGEGDPAGFEALLRQDHPECQVLFGIDDDDEAGAALIESMLAAAPEADAWVVRGRDEALPHPKIGKLAAMLPRARHDIVLVADGDMRVGPGYLRAVTAPFADPEVGVVTCPYRVAGPLSAGSLLLRLYVGAEFLPSVLVASVTGPVQFAFGSTIAVRRTLYDAIGGTAELGHYYAEDYQTGFRAHRAGHRVVLSPTVVELRSPAVALHRAVATRMRWARSQRSCRPLGYLGLGATNSALWIGALTIAAFAGAGAWAGWAAAALWLLRSCSGCVVALGAGDRVTAACSWALPLTDALGACLSLAALASRSVSWRGRRWLLGPGGRLGATA